MFDNPFPSWGIEWKRNFYNEINSFGYDLNVKNGDILFFPSWMMHHVPVNTTNNTRITISFDTTLTGPLYNESGTYLTDLK
jgi:ectoine hydroxylase-related dioxygenase (phytanoyl-CoA dioxygenase family)